MSNIDKCRNCRFCNGYVNDKVKCWVYQSHLINDSSNCTSKAPKFSY